MMPASYYRQQRESWEVFKKSQVQGRSVVQSNSTRSSLILLAQSALNLHVSGLRKGVSWRTHDDRSKPLQAAIAALRAIERSTKQ
jgi:hypothetical protein